MKQMLVIYLQQMRAPLRARKTSWVSVGLKSPG